MTKSNLLTRTNFSIPNGATPFGPFAVPSTFIGFEIVMAFPTAAVPTNWPNTATTATVFVEQSLDGGLTYDPGVNSAGPQAGGPHSGRDGEIAAWIVGFMFNPVPTHIRGRIVVTSGPLVTDLQVNAYKQ